MHLQLLERLEQAISRKVFLPIILLPPEFVGNLMQAAIALNS